MEKRQDTPVTDLGRPPQRGRMTFREIVAKLSLL
jgi:hypothetical protein